MSTCRHHAVANAGTAAAAALHVREPWFSSRNCSRMSAKNMQTPRKRYSSCLHAAPRALLLPLFSPEHDGCLEQTRRLWGHHNARRRFWGTGRGTVKGTLRVDSDGGSGRRGYVLRVPGVAASVEEKSKRQLAVVRRGVKNVPAVLGVLREPVQQVRAGIPYAVYYGTHRYMSLVLDFSASGKERACDSRSNDTLTRTR